MKFAVVLCAIVAVATATAVDDLRGMLDKMRPKPSKRPPPPEKRIEFMPPLEGEEAKPITKDQVLGLLSDVKDVSEKIKGHFEGLKDKADNIDGTEESLAELGEHTGGMFEALGKINEDELDAVRGKWFKMMQHLEQAGVEDEGQCHKLIVWLIEKFKDVKGEGSAASREMSEEELKFWLEVVKVAKEEVKCIIGRFNEFIELVSGIDDAIRNPPADYNEDGHAFEAEILMGSLFAGYRHLFRQVVVFGYTVHGLMESEENEAKRPENKKVQIAALRELYEKAEAIKREMESLKGFDKRIR